MPNPALPEQNPSQTQPKPVEHDEINEKARRASAQPARQEEPDLQPLSASAFPRVINISGICTTCQAKVPKALHENL